MQELKEENERLKIMYLNAGIQLSNLGKIRQNDVNIPLDALEKWRETTDAGKRRALEEQKKAEELITQQKRQIEENKKKAEDTKKNLILVGVTFSIFIIGICLFFQGMIVEGLVCIFIITPIAYAIAYFLW